VRLRVCKTAISRDYRSEDSGGKKNEMEKMKKGRRRKGGGRARMGNGQRTCRAMACLGGVSSMYCRDVDM